MTTPPRQGSCPGRCPAAVMDPARPFLPCCSLAARQLLRWQIAWPAFSSRCFKAPGRTHHRPRGEASQGQLFANGTPGMGPDPAAWACHFNPLPSNPQSLQFWRWPHRRQNGAALSRCDDHPDPPSTPFAPVQTRRNDRGRSARKGRPDCKTYPGRPTARALQQAQLQSLPASALGDVPARKGRQGSLSRREPPLAARVQQETRNTLATPFTSDLGEPVRGRPWSLATNSRPSRFAPPHGVFRCTRRSLSDWGVDTPGRWVWPRTITDRCNRPWSPFGPV